MSDLFENEFFDLHIGESFSEVTNLNGHKGIHPTAEEWSEEIADMRARCGKLYEKIGDPEFSLQYEGRLFRVTTIVDIHGETVYFLRRRESEIRDFFSLGYPKHMRDALMDKSLKGVVLFGGPMGAGKTESAAALLVARMKEHGETVFAAEQPPETNLNGRHGRGRCFTVPTPRGTNSLAEQLTLGVRTGADIIYVGEIRRAEEAFEAAQSGINGHLIVSTSHGSNIPDLIERVATFASQKSASANSLLADGLAAVIWQQLEIVSLRSGPDAKTNTILRPRMLLLKDNPSARTKIREGQFSALEHDVDMQSNQLKWHKDIQR